MVGCAAPIVGVEQQRLAGERAGGQHGQNYAARGSDQHRRRRIVQHVPQTLGRIGGIERQECRARA